MKKLPVKNKIEFLKEKLVEVSSQSLDRRTKVPAIIFDDFFILEEAFNSFAKNVKITEERLKDKYFYTEHAERNVIYKCALNGISTKNTNMIVSLFPCEDCARAIIQAGIKSLLFTGIFHDSFTEERITKIKTMLDEGGVILHQV